MDERNRQSSITETRIIHPDYTCGTWETKSVKPGKLLVTRHALVGCFITTIVYDSTSFTTHFGPSQRDSTINAHKKVRPTHESLRLISLFVLNIDTSEYWKKLYQEYQSAISDQVQKLAVFFQITPDIIKLQYYPHWSEVVVDWRYSQIPLITSQTVNPSREY